MKPWVLTVCTSLLLYGTGFAQKKAFRSINSLVLHLNHDSIPDTIVLSSSLIEKIESQKFNRIRISVSGLGRKTFNARDYWIQVDKEFLQTNKNLTSSNQVFIIKTNEQTVILLFGHLSGAGYRNEFSIINITPKSIEMVFDRLQQETDVQIPRSLTDLDSNGRVDLIYTGYREVIPIFKTDLPPEDHKAWENGVFEVYCPFWVYTIDTICALNKKLTRKYNEEHYAFAGFEYSEKIAVYKPVNGGKIRACKRGSKGELLWLTE